MDTNEHGLHLWQNLTQKRPTNEFVWMFQRNDAVEMEAG